jgi:hypothetical protein
MTTVISGGGMVLNDWGARPSMSEGTPASEDTASASIV